MPEDDDNVVFVGGKEIQKYINAALIQLSNNDTVFVKARGRENIGKAVDVSEIVRNGQDEVELSEIKTNTLEHEEHKVSEIELTLKK